MSTPLETAIVTPLRTFPNDSVITQKEVDDLMDKFRYNRLSKYYLGNTTIEELVALVKQHYPERFI